MLNGKIELDDPALFTSLTDSFSTALMSSYLDRYPNEFRNMLNYYPELDLPKGYYAIVMANKEKVDIELFQITDIEVDILNNKRDLLIRVKQKDGDIIGNAKVTLDGVLLEFQAETQSYFLAGRNKKGHLVVEWADEKLQYEVKNNRLKNAWNNFKDSKTHNYLSFSLKLPLLILFRPVRLIERIIGQKREYDGYVATSKPIFLPEDTVKCKAYILSRRGKAYSKEVSVKVESHNTHRNATKLEFPSVKPDTNGVYILEFALNDSLQLDDSYEVAFYRKRNKRLVSGNFYLEDYQLDEATYTLNSPVSTFYKGDTVKYICTAFDENGLPVMDAWMKAELFVMDIWNIYRDTLIVPNSLWKYEQQLDASGYTEISIPDSIIPPADLDLLLNVVFGNSNNELHESSIRLKIRRSGSMIKLVTDGESYSAYFIINGKTVSTEATMYAIAHNFDTIYSKMVNLPNSFEFEDGVDSYVFVKDSLEDRITCPNRDHEIRVSGYHTADSVFVNLINPEGLHLSYFVFKDNKIVYQNSSDSTMHWESADKSNDSYYVKYY